MPSTVNGIGTWYYGKDHLVTRHGQCEFCRAHEELKSYDTTLFFVVLFIPILPLGRRRIIDSCPRCKRHRAAKLGAWEKQKAEALLSATKAWNENRGDVAKAIDALRVALFFHDAESFKQLAPAVNDAFPRDAAVQIFLADGYDHFGDFDAAEKHYRAALAAKGEEGPQESLAKFYLRRLRPADAEPLLSHIIANRVRPKAMLMMAVAEAYQGIGENDRAWRIVDDVGTTFPDLLSDPHYEKIRRSVSRNRGTSRIVRDPAMDRTDGARQTNWLQRHMGLAIVSTILIVAAAWYLILAYSLGSHTVQLVNGTPAAYTLDINGRRFQLPPMSSTAADLREGTLKLTVPDSTAQPVQIAPTTIELHTNFWRRPWNRRTFVINPDRSAVILWEETQYAETVDDNYVAPHRLYLGEVLYDLAKPDYVFADFPNRISLGENKTITKTRVGMVKDESEALAAMMEELPPRGQIDFLRAHLSDRPLRLQFHRVYQNLVGGQDPSYDVAGEYRALVKNDPNDAQLVYLLGRVTADRAEALRLFKQAADAPQPCAYADYALASDAMGGAEFDEALKRIEAAARLEPGNQPFLEVRVAALEALGKFDEGVAVLKSAERSQDLLDAPLVGTEVRLLASKGDVNAAKKRIDEFCQQLAPKMPDPGDADRQIRPPLEAAMQYAAGDMAAYRAALGQRTSADAKFAAAITDGKLDDAQAALSLMKSPSVGDYLTLYIAAKQTNTKNDAIAQSAWQSALDVMNKDRKDGRVFAKAISGTSGPSLAEVRNWKSQPEDRCVMLAALGLRFPSQKADYFALAGKLNFSRRYPHHVIEQVLKAGGS